MRTTMLLTHAGTAGAVLLSILVTTSMQGCSAANDGASESTSDSLAQCKSRGKGTCGAGQDGGSDDDNDASVTPPPPPPPADAGSDATTTPTTCTSFTYSAWSACSTSGTQTRTVISSSPAGCTGGTPVLSQSCTYTAPTCTSFTYSAWSACSSSGTETRTVVSSSPAGCTGGTPVLSQSCTPAVSFASQVQPIFTNHCTGCHSGGTAPNLSSGSAYASLVNVTAGMCSTAKYVVPGNASASFLVASLTSGGSVGTCSGAGMAGFDPNVTADLATISTWINQGAPNN